MIHLIPHGNIIRAGDLHFPEFSFYDCLAFALQERRHINLIFASMVASSSHIDSTKKSLYPISVTTFEWSSSLLSLLENCGHPLLWMLCLLMEKVIFKVARATQSLWKQSTNDKSQPCCISGIKHCNLPSFCQPCKDILQCLFTNLARFKYTTFSEFSPLLGFSSLQDCCGQRTGDHGPAFLCLPWSLGWSLKKYHMVTGKLGM